MTGKIKTFLPILGLFLLMELVISLVSPLAWWTITRVDDHLSRAMREEWALVRSVSEVTRQQLDQSLRFGELLLYGQVANREKFELANEAFIFAGKRFGDLTIEGRNIAQKGMELTDDPERRKSLESVKTVLTEIEKIHGDFEHQGAAIVRQIYQFAFITQKGGAESETAGQTHLATAAHHAFIAKALSRLEDESRRLEGKLKEAYNLTRDLSGQVASVVTDHRQRSRGILLPLWAISMLLGLPLAIWVAWNHERLRLAETNAVRQLADPIHRGAVVLLEAVQRVANLAASGGKSLAGQGTPLQTAQTLLTELSAVTEGQAQNAHRLGETLEQKKRVLGRAQVALESVDHHLSQAAQAGEKMRKASQVMRDLVIQVELLSTNASAEAARTQATQGLAIFTDEIRGLARKIAQTVQTILDGVEGTLTHQLEGNRLAPELKQDFADLGEADHTLAQIMTGVAQGQKEQNGGLVTLHQVVLQWSRGVAQGDELLDGLATSAKVLEEQSRGVLTEAEQLLRLVGDRRLPPPVA